MPGLAITGVIGLAGISEGRRARKQSRRAQEEANKASKLRSQREAIQNVRQGIISRAQVVQQAEAGGLGGDSAVQGALGSIQSQVGGNIGFINRIFELQQRANSFNLAAQNSTFRANAFQTIGNITQTIDFDKIFGSSQPAVQPAIDYGAR